MKHLSHNAGSKRHPRSRRNQNAISGGSLIRFLFALILIIGVGVCYLIGSVGSIALKSGRLEVLPGDSVASLATKDPIKSVVSQWRYRAYIRFLAEVPTIIRPGIYTLSEGITIRELSEKTLASRDMIDTQKITILPGWNIYDIDAYLTSKGYPGFLGSQQELIRQFGEKYPFLSGASSLEGYLYPDTHEVFASSDLSSVIDKLLSGFDSKIYQKLSAKQRGTLRDDLILASIVEREERLEENYVRVASILKTRLTQSIALGADATTCYAYALTSKECTPSFIYEHARERNEYNTRILRGLPTGPIANMTDSVYFASLSAQGNSPDLYYLHDSKGVLHTSPDLAEHNRKIERYLR